MRREGDLPMKRLVLSIYPVWPKATLLHRRGSCLDIRNSIINWQIGLPDTLVDLDSMHVRGEFPM